MPRFAAIRRSIAHSFTMRPIALIRYRMARSKVAVSDRQGEGVAVPLSDNEISESASGQCRVL